MFNVINFFFKSSWKIIIIAAISSAFSAGLNILVFKVLSNLVKEPEKDAWLILLMVMLVSGLSAVVTIYSGKYVTRFYENQVVRLRKNLAQMVLRANFEKIEKKLDRLVPVLLFEVNAIGNFGKNISATLVAVFQLIGVLIYLFFLSWELTLLILIILVIQSIATFLILPNLKKIEGLISKTRFELHFGLDRMEKGIKDLFMNHSHSEKYVDNSVEDPGNRLAKQNIDLFVLKTSLESSLNTFVLVSLGLILVLALKYFHLDRAVLIEFLALVLFIIPSAAIIFKFLKDLKNVQNAQDQVQEFDVDLLGQAYPQHENITITEGYNGPLIELKDIYFSYDNQSGFALGPISLSIMQNEVIIIRGGNGSGKSTLFKIITGMYVPEKGELLFQGQSVGQNNMQGYRDLFSAYFSDSPVFSDLTYLDKERVVEYGDDLVKSLELKGKVNFDQIVHITDSGLSHGQQGRMSLLRLLLQDSEIYFLDEWAANQDVHFKQYFYEKIVSQLKAAGKTVILISHDDKYYPIADRIISLNEGRMI